MPLMQQAFLVDQACEALAETARAMLDGRISFIEGARMILSLRSEARLSDFDPDIMVFMGINSETDTLPLGPVRGLWRNDALDRLQPEIDRAERWAKELGAPSCHALIARFAAQN
jgi:hypothetical protein